MQALLKRLLLLVAAISAPLVAQAQPEAISETEAVRFCLDNTSASGVNWSNFNGTFQSEAPDNDQGIEALLYFDSGVTHVYRWKDPTKTACQGEMAEDSLNGGRFPTAAALLAFMDETYTSVKVAGLASDSHAFLDQRSSNVIIISNIRETVRPWGRVLKYTFLVTPTKP
jgi:hypothetical protein